MDATQDGGLYVVSTRGPLDFSEDPAGRPSGGGLASTLRGALPHVPGNVTWIAAAQSGGDLAAAAAGFEAAIGGKPIQLRYVQTTDWATWAEVMMRVQLYQTNYTERYGAGPAFAHYHQANSALAAALVESMAGDRRPLVMINDLQTFLVAKSVREARPDAQMWFFNHTPWASLDAWRVITGQLRKELIGSLLTCDMIAFHWERWAHAFLLQAEALGWDVNFRRRMVHSENGVTAVRVFPGPADGSDYRARAATPEVRARIPELATPGVSTIVTIDRSELTKDLLKMFRVLELLLDRRPDLAGRFVYHQHVIPTRQSLEPYRLYLEDVKAAAVEFNLRWGVAGGWQPIVQFVGNDRNRAAAGFAAYDVLVVCPVIDGMNLVAQEGPHVNHKGVVVLSENAGAVGVLGGENGAIVVDPFDDAAVAAAIELGLDMTPKERRRHAAKLHRAVSGTDPGRWLTAQTAHFNSGI